MRPIRLKLTVIGVMVVLVIANSLAGLLYLGHEDLVTQQVLSTVEHTAMSCAQAIAREKDHVFEPLEALASNEKARLVVEAILSLSRALGIETVAEGIEEESILLAVKALGCDRAQGYYMGRPAPAHTFLATEKKRGNPSSGSSHR